MSPTLLTMRRGLRRPMGVKTLCSSSQSGSFSVSSRATSRRSKSIISTPEEQRLFDNLKDSLAVSTPSSVKNRLDRFRQKKNMAVADPKMIHPSKQRSFHTDESSKDDSTYERYFSTGGTLGLDRPGKVTPSLFTTPDPEFLSSQANLATSSSTESDAFQTIGTKEPETIASESVEEAFVVMTEQQPQPQAPDNLGCKSSESDAFVDMVIPQTEPKETFVHEAKSLAHEAKSRATLLLNSIMAKAAADDTETEGDGMSSSLNQSTVEYTTGYDNSSSSDVSRRSPVSPREMRSITVPNDDDDDVLPADDELSPANFESMGYSTEGANEDTPNKTDNSKPRASTMQNLLADGDGGYVLSTEDEFSSVNFSTIRGSTSSSSNFGDSSGTWGHTTTDQSTGGQSTVDQSTYQSTLDQLTSDHSSSDQSTLNHSTLDRLASSGRPSSDQSTLDRSTLDQLASSGRSSSDQSTLDHPTLDQLASSGQSTSDQSTLDHTTLDQLMSGHSTSDQSTLDQSTLGQSTFGRSTLDQSTLDQSTLDELRSGHSTSDQSTLDQSTLGQSTFGRSTLDMLTSAHSTLDQSTLGQSTLDQSTVGQTTLDHTYDPEESTFAYSSTFATQESGRDAATAHSLQEDSVRRSASGSQLNTRTLSGNSAGAIRDSCSLDRGTIRCVETNFEGRNTAKSVETVSGLQTVKKPSTDMEEQRENSGISRTGSDMSDITTLSTAQKRVQPIPVMNYSNLFSTGSTSIWSRCENLKRDDDIFLSRAQTLLDFFEARLNSDKTEIILSPRDKKELDLKFNVSTRLRFIESLRMRCVVKSDTTAAVVKRCCRLGLEKEGAQNPIFATRALGKHIITVEIPGEADEEGKGDDPKENGQSKHETASETVSQMSVTSDWEPTHRVKKGDNPTVVQADCSAHLCGISLLVCVNQD